MLLGPKDVAVELGVRPRTAQKLMASREIESCRVGPGAKLLRCQRTAVDRYIQSQLRRYRRPVGALA